MVRSFQLNLFIVILVYNIGCIQSTEYFVSRNATYSPYCGDWTLPCPTLLDMFVILNLTQDTYIESNTSSWWDLSLNATLYVDGQNITDIISRNEYDGYNPCLPLPQHSTYNPTQYDPIIDHHITIMFSDNIKDLNDWFPRDLCNGTYQNEYMFTMNVPATFNIYNLIINDHSTATMGVWMNSGYSDDSTQMECVNCKFVNINSTSDKPWFNVRGRTTFVNTEFRNIQTSSSIQSGLGDISIQSSQFININALESLLIICNGASHAYVTVLDSVFYNISTPFYLFHDSNREFGSRGKVQIMNTAIHMLSGSIYYSNHIFAANVKIYNVSVHVSMHINSNPLFSLASSDETTIDTMQIVYLYDTNYSCQVNEIIYASYFNASCLELLCENPPTLIHNEGQLEMRDITLDIELQNEVNQDASCIQYHYINDEGLEPLIRNKKYMIIKDMVVMQSVSHILLYNEGDMIVSNLYVTLYDVMELHSLQSDTLIAQFNELASLFVNDSYFYGALTHIESQNGILVVYDSVFERANVAIYTKNVEHFVLSDSIIINNGEMYGRLHNVYNSLYVIQIYSCDDAFIKRNLVSGFNYWSLMYAKYSEGIVLEGNTFSFTINETEFVYDLSINYESIFLEPLYFTSGSYAVVIDNVFLDFEWPEYFENAWIKFRGSEGCLSGNTFYNYAFLVFWSRVTSCSRPNIIDCIDKECQLYGSVNESLFDRMNQIVVSEASYNYSYPDIIPVIIVEGGTCALDNVDIINNSSITAAIIMISDFLLIDSYVPPDVLLFTYDECDTIYERLDSNVNYISQLLVKCNGSHYFDSNYTRAANMTDKLVYVDHLRVSKIKLIAKSSLYYPGDVLKFEYYATDKLDNIVDYDGININTTINLQTESFLSTLNVENNICINCETGLLLTDISLKDIGTKYEMKVVVQDSLIATYSMLSVTITGCPVGYSPDHNNFQCQPCNTDYYNIYINNTDECASCALFENEGVKCSAGSISISYNHWMGFDENSNMVSAKCPPKYCCTKQNGCDYMHSNTDILCTENRDYTSVLCGKCKKGYSESMSSRRCVKCRAEGGYFEYLFLPFCLSILMASFLLRVDSNRNTDIGKDRNTYYRLMLKIMIFKCMFYYEQAISETVTTYVPILNIFTSFFNLSVIADDVIGDICFLNELNAKQKILIDLFVPLMLVMVVIILFLTSKYAIKTPLKIRGKRVNFVKTFLTMYVVMIGKILDVLFKLLTCANIGNNTVHFYFAFEECYGGTWFAALFTLILLIAGFGAVFVKLRMATTSQRNDPKYVLFVITSRYKEDFYWWEFVIFLRRVTVALFAALIQDNTLRLMFAAMIIFCVFLQHKYNPFVIQEANEMEFVLLCCLALAILSQFPYLNEVVITVGISIFIILPIPMIIYYVVHFKRKTRKLSNITNIAEILEKKEIEMEEKEEIEIVEKKETETTDKCNENEDEDKIAYDDSPKESRPTVTL